MNDFLTIIFVFSNKTSFFNLDEDAKVEHLLIEDGSKEAYIFSNLKVKQARTSDFTTNSILTGGKLIRNNVHPKLDGDPLLDLMVGILLGNSLPSFLCKIYMKQ